MEILDKKSNRMSRANAGVSERSKFPDLQRILDFLSLRNLLSNKLFLLFVNLQQPLLYLFLQPNLVAKRKSNLYRLLFCYIFYFCLEK